MGAAQQELVKQFEMKILSFKQTGEKYEEAQTSLQQKEKQLLEAKAELNWAKSALKSGEVKEMLAKLPGLLMGTAEKTLLK